MISISFRSVSYTHLDVYKRQILRRAVRTVTNSKRRGLFCVIEELRKEGSPLAVGIADHIESFTDYDLSLIHI